MKQLLWLYGISILILLLIIIPSGISEQPGNPLALQQLVTEEELQTYLNNLTNHYRTVNYPVGVDFLEKDMVIQEVAAPALGVTKSTTVTSSPVETKGGAATYSTTNVQVSGVDEADFIKNDGKYLYLVSGNTLSIVQAYPAQTAVIVSQTSVPGSVTDLFLTGDRLVVFTGKYDYTDNLLTSENYGPVSGERTSAIIYDISDRINPIKIREISAPGGYENARMIGNYVYFLTADSGNTDPHFPVIFDDTKKVTVDSVWCPPGINGNYRMNTLTSFPVSGIGTPEAISFLLGWDTTLYVSPTDVFIAYQNDQSGWRLPLKTVENNGRSEITSSIQESVINRFAINQGLISYKSTGTVPGYLLNQFSLDQYDGNLRVATTVDNWASSNGQYSNVYVLNPDLTIIGRVEHLAPGEKIYSARFMGDLLYLVTFKQTDPLFVIDLSNPRQPDILGKLKIPGYSDYLHPYDKTHIIGIGKDTYENSGGGVIPTGVKIALFDVSDLNNPRIVDSRVIGEKGSDSAVLTDHRAFLFDKEKNILVLPIKEVTHKQSPWGWYDNPYHEDIWQGAYVFGVDPEKGFFEKGRIRHDSDDQNDSWWAGSMVLRSVFMDSVLYTISHHSIIGSDLSDLSSRVVDIDLSPDLVNVHKIISNAIE